jgi:hypothetical protein
LKEEKVATSEGDWIDESLRKTIKHRKLLAEFEHAKKEEIERELTKRASDKKNATRNKDQLSLANLTTDF